MAFSKKNTFLGLGALLLVSSILISATNCLILTPQFYQKSGAMLGMPGEEIAVYYRVQKWTYIVEAAYLMVKVGLIASVLHTAVYLTGRLISYFQVLCVVTVAEFIFVISAFIKIVWFYYRYPNGSLADWHKTYIGSALSFFDNVPADWYYPLQTLNLFEVGYWFLLAWGLSRITGLAFDHALSVVIKSYVPALVIWVAGITFCTIMFFPQYG